MAAPIFFPKFRAFDHSTGAPLASGLVYTYLAGTSTPLVTYSDPAGTAPNPNPVQLDTNGEAWLFPGASAYKIVLTDATGVTQWTGDNLTFVATLQQSVAGHNLLMNGGFEIWQPNTSFVGAANGAQLMDGWAQRIVGGTPGDYTISRQTSGFPQSQFNVRLARNAASVSTVVVSFVQNIETADAIPAQGQFLTLSFIARMGGAFTGSMATPTIYTGTGTDEGWQTAGSLTGQQTFMLTALTAPTMATTWQQYVYVLGTPIASTVTEMSLVLGTGLFVGTAIAGDYLEFDNMQLEFGNQATFFEREMWESALYRCQRRYYKSFPYSVVPAQNAGTPGAFVFPQVVAAAVAMVTPSLEAPTFMRDIAGTITTFNPSAVNAQARNTTVGADCSVTTGVISSNEAHITLTAAAGSALGNVNAVHYVIDKRI